VDFVYLAVNSFAKLLNYEIWRIHQLCPMVKTCVFLAVIFPKIGLDSIAPNYQERQSKEQRSLELLALIGDGLDYLSLPLINT